MKYMSLSTTKSMTCWCWTWKGEKEVEKEIILKSFYGPSKMSKDKELSASNDIKEIFNNFDIKMSSILQGGSLEYIWPKKPIKTMKTWNM